MKLCTSVWGWGGGRWGFYGLLLCGRSIAGVFLGSNVCGFLGLVFFLGFFFEGVEGVERRFVEPPASSFPPLIQIDLALHRHAVYS